MNVKKYLFPFVLLTLTTNYSFSTMQGWDNTFSSVKWGTITGFAVGTSLYGIYTATERYFEDILNPAKLAFVKKEKEYQAMIKWLIKESSEDTRDFIEDIGRTALNADEQCLKSIHSAIKKTTPLCYSANKNNLILLLIFMKNFKKHMSNDDELPFNQFNKNFKLYRDTTSKISISLTKTSAKKFKNPFTYIYYWLSFYFDQYNTIRRYYLMKKIESAIADFTKVKQNKNFQKNNRENSTGLWIDSLITHLNITILTTK